MGTLAGWPFRRPRNAPHEARFSAEKCAEALGCVLDVAPLARRPRGRQLDLDAEYGTGGRAPPDFDDATAFDDTRIQHPTAAIDARRAFASQHVRKERFASCRVVACPGVRDEFPLAVREARIHLANEGSPPAPWIALELAEGLAPTASMLAG